MVNYPLSKLLSQCFDKFEDCCTLVCIWSQLFCTLYCFCRTLKQVCVQYQMRDTLVIAAG